MRILNMTRRPHPGEQNGRQNNNSVHANTATTRTSRTQIEQGYMLNPLPRLRLQQLLLRTSRLLPVHPHLQLLGYSFMAVPPITTAAQTVEFSITATNGASSHLIEDQLLPGNEHKINHYVQRVPPVTINVAGKRRLYGVGQGVLFL